jgi:hypothetical protein
MTGQERGRETEEERQSGRERRGGRWRNRGKRQTEKRQGVAPRERDKWGETEGERQRA